MLDNISLDGVAGNHVMFLDYSQMIGTGDEAKPTAVDASSAANVTNVTTDVATGVTAANPVGNAPAGNGSLAADDFFEAASYRGAFSGSNWAQGWTKLYK